MKKINVIRYGLLLICIGVLLGFISASVRLATGISNPFIGGAIVGGGIVIAIAAINRLIRQGRCAWLLKK